MSDTTGSGSMLSGRFFYGVGEVGYRAGYVVGSPAPGWFLLQTFILGTWEYAPADVLVPIEAMRRWKFFSGLTQLQDYSAQLS